MRNQAEMSRLQNRNGAPVADAECEADSLRVARILVPTDFSEESKTAIRYATRLAECFGASIHLAYVVESFPDL
jgi:hypothetical protein